MKVKEVTNFYFFHDNYQHTGPFTLPKPRLPPDLYLLVGTANLPYLLYGSSKNIAKKKKFLSKNNVYPAPRFFTKTGKMRPKGRTIVAEATKTISIYRIPPLTMLINPVSKPKNSPPLLISSKSTGRGSYFFYKARLFLAMNEEDVINHVKLEDTQSNPSDSGRERIPDETQIFVWNRDGGSCVKCGSQENLAFDHIIPHSLGGSNSRRNLQLLCDSCNLKKSNKIGG